MLTNVTPLTVTREDNNKKLSPSRRLIFFTTGALNDDRVPIQGTNTDIDY